MGNMKDKMIHIRVPEEILIKYKMLCIEKRLSMPKQTTELIKSFCDILEVNKEYIK